MWLLDQWAERHILDAQTKGEFDNLPGSGEPLTLDDDSLVPAELRAGYRLLKNAGCLPRSWSSAERRWLWQTCLRVCVRTTRGMVNSASALLCSSLSCVRQD